MALFHRERLHERLAREAGLLEAGHETIRLPWDKAGIHGVQRPREWDAVATLETAGPPLAEFWFVTLPDGSLVVPDGVGADEAAPFAAALAEVLDPPNHAEARRRSDHVWAVGARSIEVVELPGFDGHELLLTVSGEGRTLTVDGMPRFGGAGPLERLAAARFASWVAHGERLAGDLWEVQVTPL